jgi:hypothetical protein
MKRIHNANKKEMLKMAKKSGQQKTITVEGTDYILQHPGVREGVKIRGRAKDQFGNLDEEKLYEEYMKYVIVSPKTNWEHWEENDGFLEVMKEASTFLMG